ncbi:unnamed protein product [Pedinophyceae sp. YPF-701]|nr:unnamed protein product [Pedinophyceae sp. YPF-701]
MCRRAKPYTLEPAQGARRVARRAYEQVEAVGMLAVVDFSFLTPQLGTIISALVGASAIGLQVAGNFRQARENSRLQFQLEQDKAALWRDEEAIKTVAMYRGPLLEAACELEHRLWHLLTLPGEWRDRQGKIDETELMFTTYTFCQFLGYMEALRREGPRERSLLDPMRGSNSLSIMREAFLFVFSAAPATLAQYLDSKGRGGGKREHPGLRWRPSREVDRSIDHNGGGVPLRTARGAFRAIGSLMLGSENGQDRIYTIAFTDFYRQATTEGSEMKMFVDPLIRDIRELAEGPLWRREGPVPVARWTRALLLQQLLVEAFDILDPGYARIPSSARVVLSPTEWKKLAPLVVGPIANTIAARQAADRERRRAGKGKGKAGEAKGAADGAVISSRHASMDREVYASGEWANMENPEMGGDVLLPGAGVGKKKQEESWNAKAADVMVGAGSALLVEEAARALWKAARASDNGREDRDRRP